MLKPLVQSWFELGDLPLMLVNLIKLGDENSIQDFFFFSLLFSWNFGHK